MVPKEKNLVLLHGPAIVVSRQYLSNIRSKFKAEDIEVFEKNARLEEIHLSLSSQSMFSENRLIVVENPPESFNLESISSLQGMLVLWFDHEIGKEKIVSKFIQEKGGEIVFFSESKEVSIFPFLDLLGMKSPKAFIQLKKLKQSGFDTVYLITMVLYLLRSFILTNKSSSAFVQEKKDKQKNNFSLEEIKRLYEYILSLDYKVKVGNIDKDQAEFLLVQAFVK